MGKITERNAIISNCTDLVEEAKQTASTLIGDKSPDALALFYEKDLHKVEEGIRQLNEFGSKCWLISAITLYSIVYDSRGYAQSGLSWEEYIKESRQRLGLDPRDITEQLSGARFFIKYHKALERAGWTPAEANRKLARAELALDLSGDLDETIKRVASGSFMDFYDWYCSFKPANKLLVTNKKRAKKVFEYSRGTLKINGVEAITLNENLEAEDKIRLEGYLRKISDALKEGYEPAIIPVYDAKEASSLARLRDKRRQEK